MGATLERYAWTRIHGDRLDELRRNDWAPRSLRRWDLDRTGQQGPWQSSPAWRAAVPAMLELSDAMGVTPHELSDCVEQLSRAQVGSLNMVRPHRGRHGRSRRSTRWPAPIVDCHPELAATRSQPGQGSPAHTPPGRCRSASASSRPCSTCSSRTLREVGEILGVTESRVLPDPWTDPAQAAPRAGRRRAAVRVRRGLSRSRVGVLHLDKRRGVAGCPRDDGAGAYAPQYTQVHMRHDPGRDRHRDADRARLPHPRRAAATSSWTTTAGRCPTRSR